MVIVSEGQAFKIEEIRKDLPGLEKVIYLDEKENPGENDLSYESIVIEGKTFLRENKNLVEQVYKTVKPEDLANISYTSGTTADPERNYVITSELHRQRDSVEYIDGDHIRVENPGVSSVGSCFCHIQPVYIASSITEPVWRHWNPAKLQWKH
jgi:hypothetical protein